MLCLFVANPLFFRSSRHSRALGPANDFICRRPQDVGWSGSRDQFFHRTDSDLRIPKFFRSEPVCSCIFRDLEGSTSLNRPALNADGARGGAKRRIIVGANLNRNTLPADVCFGRLASIGNGGAWTIDHVVRFGSDQNSELAESRCGAELTLVAIDLELPEIVE